MADETITKSIEELSTVDEYINYFTGTGFKVLKDTENYGARTLMMRRYVMDEHSEVTIKHVGSRITVTKMVNGKPVDSLG